MIVTLQRTHVSSLMTVGQLTVGDAQCSTIERPMPLFTRTDCAIPEGQYPLVMDGDDIAVDGIPHRKGIVLGNQISYGMKIEGYTMQQTDEAHALFHHRIVEAIVRGDDVLLDVINAR